MKVFLFINLNRSLELKTLKNIELNKQLKILS